MPGEAGVKVWIETDRCTGSGLCELIEEASRACPGGCIRFEV